MLWKVPALGKIFSSYVTQTLLSCKLPSTLAGHSSKKGHWHLFRAGGAIVLSLSDHRLLPSLIEIGITQMVFNHFKQEDKQKKITASFLYYQG